MVRDDGPRFSSLRELLFLGHESAKGGLMVRVVFLVLLAAGVAGAVDNLPFPGRNGWDGDATTFRAAPLRDSSGLRTYYGSDGATIRQDPVPSSTGPMFSVTGPDGRRRTIGTDALHDSSGNPAYRFEGNGSAGGGSDE
jgi:hypothetical protein